MSLWVEKGERGLIVGQTGSGKSVMLQEQCRQAAFAPVVIYDTKNDDGFFDVPMGDETIEVIESQSAFLSIAKKPKRKQPDYILVRPNMQELMNPAMVDAYLITQYDYMPSTYAMVDEAYQLHIAAGKAGPGLLGLLTRGRSRGISTVLCTQRPAWISRFCFTEATKLYVYRLIDLQDRKRIAEISPYHPDMILDKYHFYGYKQGDINGTFYAPLQLRGVDRGYTAPDDSGIKWI